MEWLSVESAPLDGTKVDVWVCSAADPRRGHGRRVDCRWKHGRWERLSSYGNCWLPLSEGLRVMFWMRVDPPGEVTHQLKVLERFSRMFSHRFYKSMNGVEAPRYLEKRQEVS